MSCFQSNDRMGVDTTFSPELLPYGRSFDRKNVANDETQRQRMRRVTNTDSERGERAPTRTDDNGEVKTVKSSSASAVFVCVESSACVWIASQHLPGLLVSPLPTPLWQQVVLGVSLVVGVLPIAIGLVRRGSPPRLARVYSAMGLLMGLVLWGCLLGVWPREVPPETWSRIGVCVAMLLPVLVLPKFLLSRKTASLRARRGFSSFPHRVLFIWWLAVGAYGVCEVVVGEIIRERGWRVMLVEQAPYAAIVNDARRFRLAPHAKWHHTYSSDPQGYFGPTHTISYETNSLGLRERELSIPKPPGVVRVVALGDSFTLGEGVRVEDSWPRQLETILHSRYPERTIEVVNAGVNAYDTRQELEHYRRTARAYDPDLVVIAMVWNDAHAGDARSFSASFADGTAAMAQYLPVADRVGRVIASLMGRTGVATSSEQWQDSLNALIELHAQTKAAGVELVVAIYPSVRHLRNRSLQRVYDIQSEFCRKRHLSLFNAYPVFTSAPHRTWYVHGVDNHPNANAHHLFAEGLAERIAPIISRILNKR